MRALFRNENRYQIISVILDTDSFFWILFNSNIELKWKWKKASHEILFRCSCWSLKYGGFNKYKCSPSFYSLWDFAECLIVSPFFFTSVPHLDIGTTLSQLMRSLYLEIYFF